MARLTAAQRKALPPSAFAGPNRSYPVNDPAHARNALSRVSQSGSPKVKKKVRGKVHKRFPQIGGDVATPGDTQDKIKSFLKAKPGRGR